MSSAQSNLHAKSLADPNAFWLDAAKSVDWHTQPKKALTSSSLSAPRWFEGGKLNSCYNALDRHVLAGKGQQPAIHYVSPVTNSAKSYTFAELLEEVQVFAGVLKDVYGVGLGTGVLIYMPMIPEAAIAMLACWRLGAIHSVVFGGFAPKELAKRIDDFKPSVILSASAGIEPNRVIAYKPFLDSAIEIAAHKPPHCVVLQRPNTPAAALKAPRDADWATLVREARAKGRAYKDAQIVDSAHPLYLLYTSGSTGNPKGVVRDTGGHAVAITFALKYVFGLAPGDTIFAASDIGWVVGHSFIIGPLLYGVTSVLYEGKPISPDAGIFWRVINQYKVNALFSAPTAIRAIKRDDPDGKLMPKSLPTLRNVFLAGERSDPATLEHFAALLKIPVRDNYWQTETGWPVACACASPPTSPRFGSAGPAVPGYDVRVIVAGENGEGWKEAARGTLGNLVIKLPLPPGTFPTLWKNHEGYVRSYLSKFEGYYDLTDAGYIDKEGYIHIMARTDDVMNVAGHRLSTGGMEEVLATHTAVAECAVVAMNDALKGEKPVGFVVLKANVSTPQKTIATELIGMIRTQIGAIACFETVHIVEKLPKTRSGKILRRTLRGLVNKSEKIEVPGTIEDETAVAHVQGIISGAPKAKL
ncbi:hypothetical protein BJ742DRAFT_843069 [Cladochytrium replicatum]|nr:hypothetical protein BJ742DRAFT_843069 [Cladochytrium replicatum]